MTEKKLWERFSWFRDDFRNSSQVGNKLRIKGRALCATISRNDRKYIEDELLRSARTLAGKPIDVNHAVSAWEAAAERGETTLPKPKHVGHVIDADYEDGYIEYVAEINDSEYVAKLRDRENLSKEDYFTKWDKNPIHGVSVDAVYRYPQSETEKDDITVPLGIQFIRLSLVEDPETPGIKSTTIELMEMEQSLMEATVVGNVLQDFAPSLFESYKNEVVSKMSETTSTKDKPNFVVSDDTPFAYDPRRVYLMPRGDIPDSEYAFGESEVEENLSEQERLGEPFAGYDSFADCVAKNQDKDDPEAYCGEIQHKVEDKSEEASPRTEEERAKAHFEVSDEAWAKLSPEEKKAYIDRLPKRGSGKSSEARVAIPAVDKIEFKTKAKTPPKERVVETAEEEEKGLLEVKPLESKKGAEKGLREKQEQELRELETKQFRDRNEEEHKELRERGDSLADKINELVETRPQDAEALKELFEKRVAEAVEEAKAALQEVIDELGEQNSALKEKNDELVDASNAQKEAIESYAEKFGALETENVAVKETAVQLAERVEAQHTAIEELEAKIGEVGELKASFEEAKTDFETRIAALEEFKDAYGTEKEGLQTVIDTLTEKIDGFNSTIEEMTKEPEQPEENPLTAKVDKLQETIENISTHLKPNFKTPENLGEEESEPSISLEVDPVRG